jgi:hypothetical protein
MDDDALFYAAVKTVGMTLFLVLMALLFWYGVLP